MYAGTFPGTADQIARVRMEVREYLGECPPSAADDAVLIASELATNAILHSRSKSRDFTVRADVSTHLSTESAKVTYVWLEVEDLGGGEWTRHDDGRPHGLDIVAALGNWGAKTNPDGGRVVWAMVVWVEGRGNDA